MAVLQLWPYFLRVVKMEQTELLAYIEDEYGVKPDYLWKNFPDDAVFRHATNRKWFGIMMIVSADKLGLTTSKPELLLNVKLDPDLVSVLRQTPGFLPAYHMNKEKWLSIRVSEVATEQIKELLAQSYQLTRGK